MLVEGVGSPSPGELRHHAGLVLGPSYMAQLASAAAKCCSTVTSIQQQPLNTPPRTSLSIRYTHISVLEQILKDTCSAQNYAYYGPPESDMLDVHETITSVM